MALVVAVLLAIFVLPESWDIPALLAGGAIEIGEAAAWFRWSRRRRPQVGAEALVGMAATVVEPCRPLGRVRVHGELWRARCHEGADVGESVRVEEVDGLTLNVRGSSN
jgi:membrane protein implicated in regulation of membrane protease activity